MRSDSSNAWMEALEDRRFFSAPAVPVIVPDRRVRNAFIVGTFTGTATDALTGDVSSLTVELVGKETSGGAFVGLLIIKQKGKHTKDDSFTAQFSGNSFTMDFTGKDTGTIEGTASNNGKTLAGTFTTSNDHGTFTVSQ